MSNRDAAPLCHHPPRLNSSRRLVAPAVLAALSLATACGGSDDTADDSSAVETTAAVSTTTATPDDVVKDGLAADEDADNVDWTTNPAQFRLQVGDRIAYRCSAGGSLESSVWGVDTYTDDSAVCVAAVHQGLITVADGGRVVIEITEGQESYEGSTANGVTARPYGSWAGSFVFPSE